MFFIIYYLIMFISVALYFFIQKNNKNVCIFSNINYITSIFFVMLPGYFISNGNLTYFEFSVNKNTINDNVDIVIYIIYVLYIIILTFALLFGSMSAKKLFIVIKSRNNLEDKIHMAYFTLIIYIVFYFTWLQDVPLFSLFKNGIVAAGYSRLLATHGLNSIDPPFFLRYWRNIMQIFFPCLTLYIINCKKTGRIFKLLVSALQIFILIFTLEKAPVINFVVSAVLLKIILIKSYRGICEIILKYFCYIFVLIILMYTFFMESKTPINSIVHRIAIQTAVAPYEIDYVRKNGFLGMNSITMPIVDRIFSRNIVNLSKNAIIELYPNANSEDLSGAAGGLSLVDLYVSFGYFSFFIFFLCIYVIGFIDQIISNSIKNNTLLAIFYSVFSGMNMLALSSSVFVIFSIPCFFNPSVILFLIFSSLFFKSDLKCYKNTYIKYNNRYLN